MRIVARAASSVFGEWGSDHIYPQRRVLSLGPLTWFRRSGRFQPAVASHLAGRYNSSETVEGGTSEGISDRFTTPDWSVRHCDGLG